MLSPRSVLTTGSPAPGIPLRYPAGFKSTNRPFRYSDPSFPFIYCLVPLRKILLSLLLKVLDTDLCCMLLSDLPKEGRL